MHQPVVGVDLEPRMIEYWVVVGVGVFVVVVVVGNEACRSDCDDKSSDFPAAGNVAAVDVGDAAATADNAAVAVVVPNSDAVAENCHPADNRLMSGASEFGPFVVVVDA